MLTVQQEKYKGLEPEVELDFYVMILLIVSRKENHEKSRQRYNFTT
jgi:hypothetical protein